MKPVTTKVKPVPERYHSVTPYLVVEGVPKLLEFLQKTFNSTELERVPRPDGTISHAEVRIGDSVVMMGEANAQSKPMPTMLYVYVEDVDAVYKRALQAGAKPVRELKDEFYGDRAGGVADPVGNQWWIATHKEDVSSEELRRRMEAQNRA
ncbi:VOC family protein [Candidatus Bathyarchaeota archaeon]|nr:MAG: VOC family protein [Candidatus Bathyarchaeota archaeon]HLC11167.1 VOC family protein [Candidatus Bathyarchaeia archaeon]